ncbi:hypothetical protein Tco_0504512, partial [Tanacetum coccineum]
RVSPLIKQVADTQSVKETMAIANATKSLDASESVEEQVNQLKLIDVETVPV